MVHREMCYSPKVKGQLGGDPSHLRGTGVHTLLGSPNNQSINRQGRTKIKGSPANGWTNQWTKQIQDHDHCWISQPTDPPTNESRKPEIKTGEISTRPKAFAYVQLTLVGPLALHVVCPVPPHPFPTQSGVSSEL